MTTVMMDRILIRPDQVMDILGISSTTFYRWSKEYKNFPPVVARPSSRMTLYDYAHVKCFAKSLRGKGLTKQELEALESYEQSQHN